MILEEYEVQPTKSPKNIIYEVFSYSLSNSASANHQHNSNKNSKSLIKKNK